MALTFYVIFDFGQEIFAVKLIFHVFALIRYVIFHLKIFENFALRYVIFEKFVRVEPSCLHMVASKTAFQLTHKYKVLVYSIPNFALFTVVHSEIKNSALKMAKISRGQSF